ncbi:MAG: metallophosphoesterase [bacterium]
MNTDENPGKGELSKRPVRIGVLGDTHVPERSSRLPSRLLEILSDVDLIIHTGDFTNHSVYEQLNGINELRAVRGNMDDEHLRFLLPETNRFQIAGRTIGLIHGWGPRSGLEQRVLSRLGPVDILIYGHSHDPATQWINGSFLVNPGSCSGNMDGSRSCLVLELGDDIKANSFSF